MLPDTAQGLGKAIPRSSEDRFRKKLAAAVPKDVEIKYYHISSPPVKCNSLCPPPPGLKPELTFCEPHFFMVTAPTPASDAPVKQSDTGSYVALFAIEVWIYHTASLTTLFVSKADSTGYASLLKLPKQQPSLLQALTSEFISWLVHNKHRSDRRLVISLFARAQDQYLFPGSVENSKKHVLDDRGLVKWWCKTLDPVLREYASDASSANSAYTSTGHLIVPGQDKHETTAFFPPSAKSDAAEQKRWTSSHPLLQISNSPSTSPRCLIPHFSDDPKARFLMELDDELPHHARSDRESHASPAAAHDQWRSIKSLEQFWEMMAYRQECSSGRLTGFIWVLINPPLPLRPSTHPTPSIDHPVFVPPSPPAPIENKVAKRGSYATQTGPIRPRSPRIKKPHLTGVLTDPSSVFESGLINSAFPPFTFSPGRHMLDSTAYSRLSDFLLRLDFANLEIGVASTDKWVCEMGVCTGLGSDEAARSGVTVKGTREAVNPQAVASVSTANVLIGKKKAKAPS